MCAEASAVLRAVAADFFFNCWYLEIPSDNRIQHIPRCVHCHAVYKIWKPYHNQRHWRLLSAIKPYTETKCPLSLFSSQISKTRHLPRRDSGGASGLRLPRYQLRQMTATGRAPNGPTHVQLFHLFMVTLTRNKSSREIKPTALSIWSSTYSVPWTQLKLLLCCAKTKTKLRGLSPRANYTDRATSACRQS
jgi:hypothetical protein